MSLLSDQLLVAYVDSRLSPTELKLITDSARMDPQLRRRINNIKMVRSMAASEMDTPARVTSSDPNVLFVRERALTKSSAGKNFHNSRSPCSKKPGASAESQSSVLARRSNVIALLAMLAIGFALHWGLSSGFGIRGFKNDDLLVVRNSTVFASGSLLQALESAGNSVVTAQKGASRHITPLLTFKDRRKLICREYDIDADWNRQFSGVACRLPNGVWRVETHIATGLPIAAENSFAPASNGTVAIVEHLSERMKTGKAFNDAEVDNLLKSRWRVQ